MGLVGHGVRCRGVREYCFLLESGWLLVWTQLIISLVSDNVVSGRALMWKGIGGRGCAV